MATIFNNDVIRITAKMQIPAGNVQNVYHFRFSGTSGADGDTVLSDIAAALDTAYTEIQPALPSTLTFETIEAFNISQDEPIGEIDWPVLTTGGGSGQSLPPQCAPLILFGTGSPRSQGRKYLPGVTETETDGGGFITSGFAAALADFALLILGSITTEHGFVVPGNWSKLYARFAPWISAIVQTKLRTQRRRVYQIGS